MSTVTLGRPPQAPVDEQAAAHTFAVAVIGAGFSGVGAAIALNRDGIDDFVLLEKAGEVGGTWRDNTYPGCACDVPSHLYSFSFAPNPRWSRAYSGQAEIQAYLEDVVRAHDVRRRIRFGSEVTGATWNEAEQRWEIDTTTGRVLARAVISGAGPLHEPRIPDLPGLERFRGTVFHSSRWRHDHDLRGRRVAVVGTGASAIQFVPEIQPDVDRLFVFQRTAPWVLPKMDRPVSRAEQRLFAAMPAVQRAWRAALYGAFELVQLAQRHPRVMRGMQRLGLRHLRQQVRDPGMRRLLTPEFTLGCKRILMSNTWYPAITASNAEVLATGVQEVREHSIVGADGSEREVDTIIFGTGFHVTDPPIADRVRGRDGRSLAEIWQGSPQVYKGTTVSGFPNFFLLIGPNTGNGHTSALVVVEAQLDYIVDGLRSLAARGLAAADPTPEAQRRWNDEVQDGLQGTVWNAGGCSSYYLDRNGRNSSIYPWSTIDLRRRLARFDIDAYRTAARRPAPVSR
jgi:cation diffusion facilitator CzcD-associated flavoprotein CzcO